MSLGFLRETKKAAIKAGLDKATGLCRSGLDEYLNIIFPGKVWVHDKIFGRRGDELIRTRPDYLCEELKLIIEFDGIQHYQSPKQILKDIENTKRYEKYGYRVIRIPYFIQLTNKVVKQLFNVDVEEELFPEGVTSLGYNDGDPAFLCPSGIERMAKEFKQFPEQYAINIKFLKSIDDDFMTGASLLEKAYTDISIKNCKNST